MNSSVRSLFRSVICIKHPILYGISRHFDFSVGFSIVRIRYWLSSFFAFPSWTRTVHFVILLRPYVLNASPQSRLLPILHFTYQFFFLIFKWVLHSRGAPRLNRSQDASSNKDEEFRKVYWQRPYTIAPFFQWTIWWKCKWNRII